jgi:3-methyl-2-oxobutanoate hydroxymethyltransferase
MNDLDRRFRQQKQSGQKIAALTAYDYPTARIVDEAGIDFILVGDSLGMVILGYPDTTSVTLEDMIRHTGAVARGAKLAPVIADLPIGTYGSPAQAVASARRRNSVGVMAFSILVGAISCLS